MSMDQPEDEGRGGVRRPASLFHGGEFLKAGRLPSSYANPAPWPDPPTSPAVPLAIGTNHYRQPHLVCVTSQAALEQYLKSLPYSVSAVLVGDCTDGYDGRLHYRVEPCQ